MSGITGSTTRSATPSRTSISSAGSAATPAPGGIVAPDSGAYNGMVYDTTALPLSGHSVVYIAIKPQNSNLFSQIAVRLDLPSS